MARLLTAPTDGNSNDIRIRMIATTTSSSTSVKPVARRPSAVRLFAWRRSRMPFHLAAAGACRPCRNALIRNRFSGGTGPRPLEPV